MLSLRILFVPAVLLLLFVCAECQLTFSPGWGKRSAGGNSGTVGGAGTYFDPQPGNCKPSNEILLEIFHFVQSQAQLFLDCQHRE